MRSVHDSVETVNAAATAIVEAEARVQPSRVRKRRWGGWWSLYWCFGSYRHSNKRIGHALIISETTAQLPPTCYVENPSHTAATITLPAFVAPPSSPASYLSSDPALLSLSSLSSDVTAHIFLIGPYAHETQLVSPPVFSTFTTEPSTAPLTPPPEPVQMTRPSSPEVPHARLLSQKWRNSGNNLIYPLSHYDFQPYQIKSSPASAVSTSGASSPFFERRASIELRVVEAPKFVGYEHFMNYKWGSRVGSRLGSGALTPIGAEHDPSSKDSNHVENQISQVVELESDDVVDRRVSFELTGEHIPKCIMKGTKGKDLATEVAQSFWTRATVETDHGSGLLHQENRSISFGGSSKDFDFDSRKDGGADKSGINCEWKVGSKELGPQKNWTFFPMLQSGEVS